MTEHVVKLPDVGEGVAEAELVEWHVKVGDIVREDDPLADVMTDKATVEIPSPIGGVVVWVGGEIGDTMAVGSALARVKVGAKDAKDANDAKAKPKQEAPAEVEPPRAAPVVAREKVPPAPTATPTAKPGANLLRVPANLAKPTLRAKPIASPAVRLEAREAGVDLRQVGGTGPGGRISRADLQAFISQGPSATGAPGLTARTEINEVKVVGLRRRIAEKMALSKSRIPHITIVEEVNVTPIEDLRAVLNRQPKPERPKLTMLPFLMRAMVTAVAEQPGLNALFDDDAGVVRQHAGVHIGVATQTPAGLIVPVVKHVEARDIWNCAAELVRLAERARDGTATREELTGSTITITSLGTLGAIATTPVINYPEVAIVGVNRMAIRPMWDGTAFVPRKMMNLSSSFDHRVIDGWDAAVFVQRLKELIENPATLFLDA